MHRIHSLPKNDTQHVSGFSFILPYALTDILGRLAQRLLVPDSKKGRIIVQRFKSIKVKDKNR